MKNRPRIIIAVVIILAALMFVPFRTETLDDGGSVIRSALLAKYVTWVGFDNSKRDSDDTVRMTSTFRVYIFPSNIKDNGDLRYQFFYGTR